MEHTLAAKRRVYGFFRTAALCTALLFAAGALVGCSSPDTPVSSVVSASLHSYDSYDELCAALGFEMVRIGGGGFEPYAYNSIDDLIGQIEYRSGEAVLLLRMAKKQEGDITGVGQVTYSTSDHGGCELNVGAFKNVQAAWITAGDYTYALSATDMTVDDFQDIANQLADAVTAA